MIEAGMGDSRPTWLFFCWTPSGSPQRVRGTQGLLGVLLENPVSGFTSCQTRHHNLSCRVFVHVLELTWRPSSAFHPNPIEHQCHFSRKTFPALVAFPSLPPALTSPPPFLPPLLQISLVIPWFYLSPCSTDSPVYNIS